MQRAGHGRLYYAVLDSISAELCKGCQIEEHGFVPPDCQLRKQQRRRRRLDSTWVTHLTEEDSADDDMQTPCKRLSLLHALCVSLSLYAYSSHCGRNRRKGRRRIRDKEAEQERERKHFRLSDVNWFVV